MKLFLRLFFAMLMLPGLIHSQCDLAYSALVTSPNCNGSADGGIQLTVTSSSPFNTSTRGLLISAVHTNPSGNDSPFEFVELVATRTINFATTPYTVIWNNNGSATSKGWVEGGSVTYAFLINSGSVVAGDVVYVGGSSMVPATNQIRTINTATTNGDGGIGSALLSGVLGNGGSSCDGVAVFDLDLATIDSNTVPIDAIFFGTTAGTSVVAAGTEGYELPVNDLYSGGKLQTTSFIAADPISGQYLVASNGIYDVQTNSFTAARVWSNSTNYTDGGTAIQITGLYNFSWSNSETSQDLVDITAGTYSVTITDGAGCVLTPSINVTQPFTIITAPSQIPASCTAANGTAIIVAAGGTPGYTFSWSPGGSTNDTLSALPGTYTVTTTDANGCTRIDSVSITRLSTVSLTTTQTNITCNGASTGTASASAVGGTSPYTFNWTPGGTGSSLTGLAAGQYIITAVDSFGCTATKTITLTEPTAINTSSNSTNSLACSCTGSATITVTGGDTPYSYNWSPVNSTINTATSLCPGTYSVIVTDANGCAEIVTVVVGSTGTLISLNATINAPSCNNTTNGSIKINASGGAAPYTYTWLPNISNSDSAGNLAPGNYIITVNDSNNCAAIDTFVVPVTLPFTNFNLGADTTICSVAALTLCAPAGNYTYVWTTAATTSCITVNTADCYGLTIADQNGCTLTDSICVSVDICTGLEEISDATPLLYPNPATDQITIQLQDAKPMLMELFDVSGRIVLQKSIQQTITLDVASLQPGLYLIRIGNSVQRVVIE